MIALRHVQVTDAGRAETCRGSSLVRGRSLIGARRGDRAYRLPVWVLFDVSSIAYRPPLAKVHNGSITAEAPAPLASVIPKYRSESRQVASGPPWPEALDAGTMSLSANSKHWRLG